MPTKARLRSPAYAGAGQPTRWNDPGSAHYPRRARSAPRARCTRLSCQGMDDESRQISLDRSRAVELVPVSRETLSRLDRFVELLLLRNQTTNLIASSTVPHVWTRHVADSLQLASLAQGRVWADL